MAERMRLIYRDSLLNQERVEALTGLEVQFETEKRKKNSSKNPWSSKPNETNFSNNDFGLLLSELRQL